MKMLISFVLYPLSLVYGIIVFLRNKFFDYKILSSREFHIPVISVGNITVGGTGKTPHVEYLIHLLTKNYRIAFLSRGYKRQTHGFVLANEFSGAADIGDEPFQIKRKFPEIIVAVDGNRVRGIELLIKQFPDVEVILLDDAFQHRHVTPGINILLIDHNRPIYKDHLLPYGRLRESFHEKKRADIFIFSKVPPKLTPLDIRLLTQNAQAKPYQKVYFSSFAYGNPVPVFHPGMVTSNSTPQNKFVELVLITGIANPAPFIKRMTDSYTKVIPFIFPDHHNFTMKEISAIENTYREISSDNKAIITTEKDAARLLSHQKNISFPDAWYYIPVTIEFLKQDKEAFNQQILHYISNNGKNSILYN